MESKIYSLNFSNLIYPKIENQRSGFIVFHAEISTTHLMVVMFWFSLGV